MGKNIYRKVIRDVIRKLSDEMVEMYGEGDPIRQNQIRVFLESKENHLVEKVYGVENLFEQVELSADAETFACLEDFLDQLDKEAS